MRMRLTEQFHDHIPDIFSLRSSNFIIFAHSIQLDHTHTRVIYIERLHTRTHPQTVTPMEVLWMAGDFS